MSQALQERRTRDTSERAQPLSDVERLRKMLDQTFGSFGLPALATESVGWTPPVDIEEQDDAYVIEAELPGVEKDDVNIELVSNELTITGEIKEREREGILRKRTRRIGRFEYRVRLPEQVDPDNVEAKLADGVLSVRDQARAGGAAQDPGEVVAS
jgi:HSP20 family protein